MQLHCFQNKLDKALTKFENGDTELKKRHKAQNLKDSIKILDDLAMRDQKFSGLTKNFLKKCNPYQNAKVRITDFENNS